MIALLDLLILAKCFGVRVGPGTHTAGKLDIENSGAENEGN